MTNLVLTGFGFPAQARHYRYNTEGNIATLQPVIHTGNPGAAPAAPAVAATDAEPTEKTISQTVAIEMARTQKGLSDAVVKAALKDGKIDGAKPNENKIGWSIPLAAFRRYLVQFEDAPGVTPEEGSDG